MISLILTGSLAGLALGYVFQRADLCFHSAWRGLLEGRLHLVRMWILGVALTSVGLSLLYAIDRWPMNEGLAFRPQGNVLGGLISGLGMVVAASCVSGLFYKLGSGMLGAAVGLLAWSAGDVVGNRALVGRGGGLDLRGSTVDWGPTIPEVLGLQRGIVSVAFLMLVAVVLARAPRPTPRSGEWTWLRGGVALGAATTLGWVLAGAGGASFGPSTVGAPASLVNGGGVAVWQVSFLVALTAGALMAARLTRTFWARGESPTRYVQLAVGGGLLGLGGSIGGGCNLGHGLSGAAQLNLSSWVTVGSIIAGIALGRAVQRRITAVGTTREWRAHADELTAPG